MLRKAFARAELLVCWLRWLLVRGGVALHSMAFETVAGRATGLLAPAAAGATALLLGQERLVDFGVVYGVALRCAMLPRALGGMLAIGVRAELRFGFGAVSRPGTASRGSLE
jgi:hypothetical protein